MMHQRKTNHTLLEVKNFSLTFSTYQKGLKEINLNVIKKLNLTIHEGEIVAIVGASGSGKSLLANAILGILPKYASWQGGLMYKGKTMTNQMLEQLRGTEIALIPQSVEALNPLMKVGKQVQEVISSENKKQIQQAMFQRVGLPIEIAKKYPFELSGGMARRVLVSSAMVSSATLIIADEPTPGLDPVVLSETSKVIRQLADKGKGIMFISHDIRTALAIADKIVVFNEGETIETADVEAFSGNGEKLKHPYTRRLWNALPENQFLINEQKISYKNEAVSDDNILHASQLSFKYKSDRYLFKDLSLTIKPGEIVGMHGYSGSGKTTLAKILAGYLKPLTGKVMIKDQVVNSSAINPVQLVWQHPEKAINPKWRMEKVLEESGVNTSSLLDELGIKTEWLSRRPSELSGGELQRFCLARALCDETKFLIADEITTMLDAITQAKLWHHICRIAKERNIGVLAISHDQQLLHQISDRIISLGACHHPNFVE